MLFSAMKKLRGKEMDDRQRTVIIHGHTSKNRLAIRARFDDGSDISLIARKIVEEELGLTVKHLSPDVDPTITVIGDLPVELAGTVELVWHGENPGLRNPAYTFRAKRYKTVFYMPVGYDVLPVDMSIGTDLIDEFNLNRRCSLMALRPMSRKDKKSKEDEAKAILKEQERRAKVAEADALRDQSKAAKEERRLREEQARRDESNAGGGSNNSDSVAG